MNAQLRTEPLGAIILALIFATVAMAACTDEPRDGPVTSMIGTVPAEPTSTVETPTPVEPASAAPQMPAGKDSSIGKKQESVDMPLPGQANDHSTLAPDASQKAAPAPSAAPR
jgi:hypothetical protein